MKTKEVYANCQFGLFYLVLRGKAERIILAPGGKKFVPWHMGILNKKGHYLNFRRSLPHEQNLWGAWWFIGSFQGLSKKRWRKILSRKGRIHQLPVCFGLFLLILMYILLFFPWITVWMLYGPAWTLGWGSHAVYKFIKKEIRLSRLRR